MIRKAIILLLTLAAMWTAHWWFLLARARNEIPAEVLSYGVLNSDHFVVSFSVGAALPTVEMAADRLVMRVPPWMPFVLFGVFPMAALIGGPLRSWRRWSRRRRGLCIKCGYSLTGLLEPRCPECGRKIREVTR
jgi:hypothetical protein